MSSIRIVSGSFQLNTQADDMNILSLLQRENISVFAPCGGNGTCGKCAVTIEKNDVKQTVLACQTQVSDGMTIYVDTSEDGDFADNTVKINEIDHNTGFGRAVDIGTTTIVCGLYNLENGELIGRRQEWNRQSAFGADVITRIQYIMENPDGLEKEKQIIIDQVFGCISDIAGLNNIGLKDIKNILISGNTIMQHIFAGIDPSSIAVAPFTPKTLFDSKSEFVIDNFHITFSPCASGYVGGDVISGMMSVGLNNTDKMSLFLDIGTNGEMAIGNKDGFVCCSVATGPAFEGAQISCGMPSVNGAVAHVSYDGDFIYTTVGNCDIKGICGSGIIDLIRTLLKLGIIDSTGRMLTPDEVSDEFSKYIREDADGNCNFYITDQVYFTQRDVRKIQLAKAAVMAGINVLLRKYSINYPDIDKVYIAGGFGSHLDCENSAFIGMLPQEIVGKIECVGNASFAGRSMAVLQDKSIKEMKLIQQKCKYIELSESEDFRNEYIEQMIFENGKVDY